MSVCLAFDRSRARNYAFLVQVRKFAAYLLARNISRTIRWIPSELNKADRPSRLDTEETSKILTDLLPSVWGQEREGVETPSCELTQESGKDQQARGSQDREASANPGERAKSGKPKTVGAPGRISIWEVPVFRSSSKQPSKRTGRAPPPATQWWNRAWQQKEKTGKESKAQGQAHFEPFTSGRRDDVPGSQCDSSHHLQAVRTEFGGLPYGPPGLHAPPRGWWHLFSIISRTTPRARLRMGLFLLTALSSYSRPSELLRA